MADGSSGANSIYRGPVAASIYPRELLLFSLLSRLPRDPVAPDGPDASVRVNFICSGAKRTADDTVGGHGSAGGGASVTEVDFPRGLVTRVS